MTPQACMGGWCLKRDTCSNYLHGAGQPVERLCQKGRDGVSGLFSVQPIDHEEDTACTSPTARTAVPASVQP
ncbi:hypothetical protein J7U46_09670 [Pelomonas sp. V22]|uniref:hypothetical protein n=1 Tax=Pelomonas sp. V22 TaxID=2822139 RepID=UPI0024A9E8FA|nr:hypothetical protein [Pelomonas sp. V22]MDI4633314.1 hypothetical protein [Pelomonas sp. V22]